VSHYVVLRFMDDSERNADLRVVPRKGDHVFIREGSHARRWLVVQVQHHVQHGGERIDPGDHKIVVLLGNP
jgi:hypothetical protein